MREHYQWQRLLLLISLFLVLYFLLLLFLLLLPVTAKQKQEREGGRNRTREGGRQAEEGYKQVGPFDSEDAPPLPTAGREIKASVG